MNLFLDKLLQFTFCNFKFVIWSFPYLTWEILSYILSSIEVALDFHVKNGSVRFSFIYKDRYFTQLTQLLKKSRTVAERYPNLFLCLTSFRSDWVDLVQNCLMFLRHIWWTIIYSSFLYALTKKTFRYFFGCIWINFTSLV